jgi:hypothetical protein
MTDLAALMLRFESLGDNCEFGLVQREYGVEPLGLMRWTRCALPSLMKALDERFAAMGDPDRMVVHHFKEEYLIADKSYNFSYHPHVQIDEMTEADLLAREKTRIEFLRTKLLDDLADAEKIFVFKENAYLSLASARRLFRKLREFGPNRLLYVVPTTDPSRVGTVERVEDGLIRGYTDGFGQYATLPDGIRFDTWAAICEGAELFLQR